jgi:hypothetical protein
VRLGKLNPVARVDQDDGLCLTQPVQLFR